MSLAGVCIPSGSWNSLLDVLPVGTKACLALSFVVPTCNVVPLSAMADGMEPLRTPRLRWLLPFVVLDSALA